MASTDSPPKITLHWLELSRAQRILWLFEELEVPYELKTYKRHNMRADPELKKIHPLGKSPLVTVEVPGREPLIFAESAAIVEYICDYYGSSLVPKRYIEGEEGKIGGETDSWLRYRYFMHYAEGSIFPLLLVSILMRVIKDSPVPFFIRPITNGIVSKMTSMFLKPEFESHYKFLESQLETSPDGGLYLCGKDITAADFLMQFPLEVGESRSGMSKEQFPRIWGYMSRLHERESYKRAVQKIEKVEGEFKSNL